MKSIRLDTTSVTEWEFTDVVRYSFNPIPAPGFLMIEDVSRLITYIPLSEIKYIQVWEEPDDGI